MTVILSNKKWFATYLVLRYTILAMLLLVLATMVFVPGERSGLLLGFHTIVLTFVVVLFLFEYQQQPAYLRVLAAQGATVIELYIPDGRYLFFLKKEKIRVFTIPLKSSISAEQLVRLGGLFKTLTLAVTDAQGHTWRSKPIGFNWASKADWENLAHYLTQHNQG